MSASSNLVPIGAIRQPVHGRHHILSVLVENKAGVLARVALLFSRRGFNIYSLAVAPTDDERFSRITMVVDVETAPLEQITKQLHKLINVLKITELDPSDAVEVESMLVTIVAEGGSRSRALELAELFRGQVLDVNAERLTLMFALAPSALDDVEALLGEFGIVEVQRSGRIALARLPKPVRRVARRGKVS
ncbi:acetolactate synthase, small subunit [Acidimicrobium ferrooxidans DSM 10331]|uniref:Acetolactate synthase small subunit n=1 Tax=Acidimicrobium ferrooxidans (strain DSM 10331 / JCM 15462 / NBRC 103882 / ICP) TaxID=525909 RepID=C7M0G0_ACIFD|nr:acetolactate synthase small subunit [Acidimicrobium ferrooxidans]ACU54468.1 acetolactate synthase, small subunit [Acidimicrobium ferrooxidans DSM 10331]